MKRNLALIAEGNATAAINGYQNEIQSESWMENIDENYIYAENCSPQFKVYLDILGLEEPKGYRHAA